MNDTSLYSAKILSQVSSVLMHLSPKGDVYCSNLDSLVLLNLTNPISAKKLQD